MNDKTLDAVYKEDLPRFLKSIGQLERIEMGSVFCCICGDPISMETIQLIIPFPDQQFKFVCKRPACVERYHDQGCCS